MEKLGQNFCVCVHAPKSDRYVGLTKNKFQDVLPFLDLMKNCRQPEAAALEI